jgi:hypothetical protein
LLGRGLYLTDDLEVAKFYGDTIQTFEINGKLLDANRILTLTESKKIHKTLCNILKFQIDLSNFPNEDNDMDYIGIAWGLDSDSDFQNALRKNKLFVNEFYTQANVCTALNLALQKLGYVGLKYSTSEIENLDDVGLDRRNAFLIFDKTAIKEL